MIEYLRSKLKILDELLFQLNLSNFGSNYDSYWLKCRLDLVYFFRWFLLIIILVIVGLLL